MRSHARWFLLMLLALCVCGAKKAPPSAPATPAEVPDLPDGAAPEAITAKAELDRANARLKRVVDAHWKRYEHSPDVKKAIDEMKQAQDASDSATRAVFDRLMADRDYVAALKQKDAATTKLEQMRAEGSAQPPEIASAAAVVMKATTVLNRMETEALSGDARARDAKERLADAQRALGVMHEQFESSLRTYEDYRTAKAAADRAASRFSAAASRSKKK